MTWVSMINDAQTDEVVLACVELNHSSWPAPRRYVGNTEDVTVSGSTYTAAHFQLTMPVQAEGRAAEIRFEVYDGDGELFQLLRDTAGPVQGEVFWVLASAPSTIHVGPYDVEIAVVEQQQFMLSGAVSAYPVFEESVNAGVFFNAISFPGLR